MKKQKPKKEVLHPDDHFFSVVMREAANARAYLVNFYPQLSQQLDLDSLILGDTSFINPQFKTFDSDIVYRCRFKDSSEELYFSLLWEHKAYKEEEVAIQIGLYIFQALYKLSKDRDKKLEPVIPLLFYNGKGKWEPKSIKELFQEHPFFDIFKPYLPNFEFLFKNITGTPHEELLAIEERFFRSAMVAMANRYNADLLMEYISVIFDNDDQDHLKFMGTYFFAIIERSPEEIKKAIENLEFITKSKIMSTLTMLREEGKQEGLKVGKQLGLEEGEEKGKYKKEVITIRNMTLKKVSAVDIAEFLSLSLKYVQQIQKALKKEASIIAALAKKQLPAGIAKKMKVSVWLVEVVRDLQKNKL